jgi:hypothetical protein
MPQQQLNRAQIGAMINQMGRKSMSQSMWRQIPLNTGFERQILDTVPQGLPRHRSSEA